MGCLRDSMNRPEVQDGERNVEPERVVQRKMHHFGVHVRPLPRNPAQCIENRIHDQRRDTIVA